jgi:hypothetical protein
LRRALDIGIEVFTKPLLYELDLLLPKGKDRERIKDTTYYQRKGVPGNWY